MAVSLRVQLSNRLGQRKRKKKGILAATYAMCGCWLAAMAEKRLDLQRCREISDEDIAVVVVAVVACYRSSLRDDKERAGATLDEGLGRVRRLGYMWEQEKRSWSGMRLEDE